MHILTVSKKKCLLNEYSVNVNTLTTTSTEPAKYAENEKELALAVQFAVNREKPPLEFDKIRSFVRNYFTLPNDGEEYLRRIERELLHAAF